MFWNTPELVEILLSFLDGKSIANLAEVHDLSLKIVKCPRVWNNVISRSCPQLQEGIRDDSGIFWWQKELETTRTCLVMNQDKVQALSTVLDLTKGPQKHEMQMDLLHLLCKRFPGTEKGSLELGVVVKCTCPYKNHCVSRDLCFCISVMLGSCKSRVFQLCHWKSPYSIYIINLVNSLCPAHILANLNRNTCAENNNNPDCAIS